VPIAWRGSTPRRPIATLRWAPGNPMMVELPRPGLNRIINDLGASVANRTDRLASDISYNAAQIERLQSKLLTSNVVWAIILIGWVVLGW
jgi:hypothetical protein